MGHTGSADSEEALLCMLCFVLVFLFLTPQKKEKKKRKRKRIIRKEIGLFKVLHML